MILRNESDTARVAAEVAKYAAMQAAAAAQGISIALCGPLGAGKTTFVRFLARELGIEDDITSPTFVLQHLYEDTEQVLDHWDVYRLDALPEELMEPPAAGVIRCIEWCDRFSALLESVDVTLSFSLELAGESGEFRREVKIAGIPGGLSGFS